MEKDKLSSLWQGIASPQKSQNDLSQMFRERSNPILKSIKKQILMELLGFTAFLFCYYSMFDGGDKPLFVNIIITTAILAPTLHHIKGYRLQGQFKSGNNLKDDLTEFVAKLKIFRLETLIARIIFISGMILFFTYKIEFSESKLLALAFIIVISILLLGFLHRIWSKRVERLELALEEFKNSDG